MTQPEQQATGNTPAATPLDYAGPMPSPRSGWKARVLEALVVLGIILLLIALLMPSTGKLRSREASQRISCMANLRSIGHAIQMYANAHGGRYPDTLEHLYLDGHARDPRLFICVTSTDTPASGSTPEAIAADLAAGGHLSYVYVGRGLTTTAGPYTVVMYEHPAHHKGVGGNVLYADGHAEWLNAAEFRSVVDWHAAGNGPMVRRQPVTSWAATRPLTQPARGIAP